MCGITGEISLSAKKPNQKAVRKMLDRLVHRGPSGSGEWTSGSVCFAMRRLSIIDVDGGNQPLFSEDGDIAIIGNGEIYNYKELQKKLRHRHSLKTGSDIETIVHLYQEYGVECLSLLRGMFAFALHDTKKNIVLIARDRVGEKPLYWARVKESIIFSSEMKSLLAFPGVEKKIDPESIHRYFSYYFVPEPDTMLSGVHKLPAGKYMHIDLISKQVRISSYWDTVSLETTRNENPTTAIRNILNEVGKMTLRSDVPVGVSLSGGLDSSAVLAFAAKHAKSKIKAFCVGYEDRTKTDERDVARKTAKEFGVEFVEQEITTSEMVRDFPMTVYRADDPIADIAAYSIYRVAKLAHDHKVPVLLGGIGGDEIFWGYTWVREAASAYERTGGLETSFYERSAGFRFGPVFLSWLGSQKLKKTFFTKDRKFWMPNRVIERPLEYARFALRSLREGWLKGDCIPLGDRMSMAASVEMRLPLLDYKLIEEIVQNRRAIMAYNKGAKHYFKAAVRSLLPASLLSRKKQGFTPPVKRWLFAILSAYMPLLDGGFLVSQGYFSSKNTRIIRYFWMFLPFFWYQLYCALVLEIWCRCYITGTDPSSLRTYK